MHMAHVTEAGPARLLMPGEFVLRRAYMAIAMKGKRDAFADQFHKRLHELQPRLVRSLSANEHQQKKRLMLLVDAIVAKIGDAGTAASADRTPAELRDARTTPVGLRTQHIVLAFVDALEFSTNQILPGEVLEWFEGHVLGVLSLSA
jgi:hypothetical protein